MNLYSHLESARVFPVCNDSPFVLIEVFVKTDKDDLGVRRPE